MRSKQYSVKPAIEILEGRRMFSASPAGDVSSGAVPFIGPMEAHEYAASQAQVKTLRVAAATTADGVQDPAPKTVRFWASDPQSTARIGGWLRSDNDD